MTATPTNADTIVFATCTKSPVPDRATIDRALDVPDAAGAEWEDVELAVPDEVRVEEAVVV
jgi:hypothetical protein